jgi:hypothetical protein
VYDNVWQQSSQQRLSFWKKFREEISTNELKPALEKTTKLWSYAPYVTYYLDPANTQEWPNPWQLLDENYYCDIAKTLGMFYTIALSQHGVNQLNLEILFDTKRKENINIVIVNNEYVLNYDFGEIVNIDTISKQCQLRYSYSATDLKIQEY